MADLEKTAVTTADASPIDAEKGAEIMEKYEKESRTRKFTADWLNKLVYVLCLAFTLYHLAYASGIHVLQMVNIKHHAIHVGLVLVIGFLLYPAFKKSSQEGGLVRLGPLRALCGHAHLCLYPLPGVHLHGLPG